MPFDQLIDENDYSWIHVSHKREPASPCGACRQALVEYETLAEHNVEVLLVGEKDIYIIPSVKALLPFAFTEF